ncbi:MAG: hypothetical protein AAFP84_11555 [Actinomycetota bacterium]
MSILSPTLIRRIRRRHHTVTMTELLDDGVAIGDVRRWIGVGVLTELAPGVLAVTDALRLDPFHVRAAALALADPIAVCDPITSARCWELPGVFRPTRPTTVDDTTAPRTHVVRRLDGIRLLSPAATWFGLAGLLSPSRFVEWSAIVLDEHVDVRAAHDVVRRSADPGRAAHRRAATVLSSRRAWQRPSGNGDERRVRASLRRRGLAGLDGTHTIEIRLGGTVYSVHPTAVDHELRWGVEVDHVDWHGGRRSDELQHAVDLGLRRAGWHITTVTDRAVRRDATAAMDAVVAERAERRDALDAA